MKFFSFLNRKKDESQKRSFQGATMNRLTGDWISSNLSQDAEIRGSLKVLRNRARDLGRNNDYIRSFYRAVENNVIGRGIPFQAQQKGIDKKPLTEVNSAIEEGWKRWTKKESCHVAGTLSFNDIERLVVRSMAESGEIFIRMVPQKFGKSKVPFALQVLEADLLDETFNGNYNGNTVRMGIEFNEWGRPVAYHFYSYHPGDLGLPQAPLRQDRVRVSADEVVHLFVPERPVQSRGFPWVCSAMFKTHQLKGFEEATVIGKRVKASNMGFIQSPEGELQGDAVEDGDQVTDFQPGKFAYLAPGETVVVPNLGGDSNDYNPFVQSMLRSIAAGIGMSYMELAKDYSQSNYSSSRLSLISERDYWRTLQDFVIRNFHQTIFEKWLDMAVMSGAINVPGYFRDPEPFAKVRWMPRGWDWIDPVKDVAADIDANKGLLRTHTEILAEQGKDFEETVLKIAEERKFMAEHGIDPQSLYGEAKGKPSAEENTEVSEKNVAS